MPLNTAGEIVYRPAPRTGGVRFQANPPVCNRCEREITRQNFGWASLRRDRQTPGHCEVIECAGCTARRQGGIPLTLFLARHKL